MNFNIDYKIVFLTLNNALNDNHCLFYVILKCTTRMLKTSFSIHDHIQSQVTHPRGIHWVQYEKYKGSQSFKGVFIPSTKKICHKKYRLLRKNVNDF